MYVCICNAVTERQILQAVADGARTIADLEQVLGLGSRCGACASFAEEVLEEGLEGREPSPALFPQRKEN